MLLRQPAASTTNSLNPSILEGMVADRDQVFFSDRKALRAWFEKNSSREVGIWAVYYKQSTGLSDMSWTALVEECLCFGWIDSVPGKVDDQRTKHYISPRKPTSGWSARNKQLLKRLQAEGLIAEQGLQAIKKAKANGSWMKLDLSEKLVVPEELGKELKRSKVFAKAWEELSSARKRTFLEGLYGAKTMPTKLKKIEQLKKDLGLG